MHAAAEQSYSVLSFRLAAFASRFSSSAGSLVWQLAPGCAELLHLRLFKVEPPQLALFDPNPNSSTEQNHVNGLC